MISGYPAVVYGVLLAFFVVWAHWYNDEGARTLAATLLRLALYLVGAALALKAAAARRALQALYWRRLASGRALAGCRPYSRRAGPTRRIGVFCRTWEYE